MVEDHVPNTMKALSDVKSLILFKTIAASSPSTLISDDLNRNLRLRSKQLYSRISSLVNAGLLKKQSGRYFLTSYGRVIRASFNIMNKPSLNYPKLVAIDAIEASNVNNNAYPEEERKNIVQILVQNKVVRDILSNGDIIRTAADNESQGQSISDVTIPQ